MKWKNRTTTPYLNQAKESAKKWRKKGYEVKIIVENKKIKNVIGKGTFTQPLYTVSTKNPFDYK